MGVRKKKRKPRELRDDAEMGFAEIGRRIGLSPQRVSQILYGAIAKLRKNPDAIAVLRRLRDGSAPPISPRSVELPYTPLDEMDEMFVD